LKWGLVGQLSTFPGSWGNGGDELDDALKPLDDEPVIRKHRFSSFYGTPLNEYMRRAGADTLVIAGVSTANCAVTYRGRRRQPGLQGHRARRLVVRHSGVAAGPAARLRPHWEALRNIQANHGDVLLSTEFLQKIGA